MRKLILLVSSCWFLSLSSCGEPGPPVAGAGGIPGSIWKGDFQPKLDGGLYGAAQKVSFNFSQNESFVLSAAPDLSAQGKYTDYAENHELSMDINDSNFDLFGSKGQTRLLQYDLGEEELKMQDDSGRYLLVRDKVVEQKPFDGDWNCRPTDGSRWSFNFSKVTYRASKTIANNNPIYFEGSVDYSDEGSATATALLTVKTASKEKYEGQKLLAKKTGSEMQLQQLDDDFKPNPNLKPINCSR